MSSNIFVSETGYCINLMGSYFCFCRAGYQWDGTTCRDVDECLENLQICNTGFIYQHGHSFLDVLRIPINFVLLCHYLGPGNRAKQVHPLNKINYSIHRGWGKIASTCRTFFHNLTVVEMLVIMKLCDLRKNRTF